jgi:hypothetical protein
VVAVIAGLARLRYGAKVDSNTQIFTQLAREITALKDAQTENIKLMFLPLALSFLPALRKRSTHSTSAVCCHKGHPSHYFLFLSSTPQHHDHQPTHQPQLHFIKLHPTTSSNHHYKSLIMARTKQTARKSSSSLQRHFVVLTVAISLSLPSNTNLTFDPQHRH